MGEVELTQLRYFVAVAEELTSGGRPNAAGWPSPPSAAAERASTLAGIYAQLLQVAVAPS